MQPRHCDSQAVPVQHRLRVILPQLVLLFLTGAACSAESLQLIVSNETAPSGETVQFKIRAAEPRRISAGWLQLRLGKSAFAEVRSVASFSAAGDAMGYGQVFTSDPDYLNCYIWLQSPSGAIGQLPDLPVIVVTATLKSGLSEGTPVPVIVAALQTLASPSNSAVLTWLDPNGSAYETTATQANIRVGGTLSVADVRPGGGLLSANSTVVITGTGFDAGTTVSIDGVAFESTRRGPNQIDLRLSGAVELTGRRVVVRNSAGEQVDFYPSLPTRPADAVFRPGDPAYVDTHVVLPLVPRLNGKAGNGSVKATQVLQNPGTTPVQITWQSRGRNRAPVFGNTTIAPGEQIRITPDEVDSTAFSASGPVRSVVYNRFYRPALVDWVTVPDPLDSFPRLTVNTVSGNLDWSAQRGSRELSARQLFLSGTGRVRIVKEASGGWLSLDTPSDIIDITPTTSVTVRAKTDGLAPGRYSAAVTISPVPPPGLESLSVESTTVTAVLTITEMAEITIAGGALFTQRTDGSVTPSAVDLYVLTNGEPVAFTARVEEADWLTLSSTKGTAPGTVTITANPGTRPPGLYTGRVTITGGTTTITEQVQLYVQGPPLQESVRPSPVSISATAVTGRVDTTQTIHVSRRGTPNTRIEYMGTSGWLSITGHDISGLYELQLRIDATSLAAGTYRASILVTAEGYTPETVPVSLTVLPAPARLPLRTSPPALRFVVPAGVTSEKQQVVVNVDSGVEYVRVSLNPGTVSLDYSSSALVYAERFALYPTPFAATATSYNTSPGVYSGILEFIALNSSVRVPWTAIITSSGWSPPTLANVVNAASQLPGPLVPGGLYSLHGSGIGGAGPTEVRIAGQSATVLYSSPNQINFAAPAALPEGRLATLEVFADSLSTGIWELPVASAAPAIFTANATGRGLVAGPEEGVDRGSVVSLWITGQGRSGLNSAKVIIGGVDAAIVDSSEEGGLLRLGVKVPETLPSGATYPALVSIGTSTSQLGAVIRIK